MSRREAPGERCHDKDDPSENRDDEMTTNGSNDNNVNVKSTVPRSTILPVQETRKLEAKIVQLAQHWAVEEQLLGGGPVFYWHILSPQVVKTIATQVPMTVEELSGLGVLGESKLKDYSVRLVRLIQHFVDDNELHEHMVNHQSILKQSKHYDEGKDRSDEDRSHDNSKPEVPAILPLKETRTLTEIITKLTEFWAEEEREVTGGKVFYWHILSPQVVKTIAKQVPMTVEELSGLGVLGEKKLKDYGDRLVFRIRRFVEEYGLHEHIVNHRRPLKRSKHYSEGQSTPTSRGPGHV